MIGRMESISIACAVSVVYLCVPDELVPLLYGVFVSEHPTRSNFHTTKISPSHKYVCVSPDLSAQLLTQSSCQQPFLTTRFM